MPKLGRPRVNTSKGSVNRSINLPIDIHKKCIWLADYWTREALNENDGSKSADYWTVPRVISSVLAEYFESLESLDPTLMEYFEKCRNR